MGNLYIDVDRVLSDLRKLKSSDCKKTDRDKFHEDLHIKDMKYEYKMREKFDLELSKIDTNTAKELLVIRDYLLYNSWFKISYDDDICVNILKVYLYGFDDPVSEFDKLINFKARYLLPEPHMNWFKNELRRSLFLTSLIERNLEGKTYQGELELLEAIYNCLRYQPGNFNRLYIIPEYRWTTDEDPVKRFKSRHIELVKSIYLNNCASSKDIKWIVSSNSEQIDWAYDYLDKKKERKNKKEKSTVEDEDSYIILKRVFFPQNTKEKYELILASIDKISNIADSTDVINSYSERENLLNKMQNAWRSRK